MSHQDLAGAEGFAVGHVFNTGRHAKSRRRGACKRAMASNTLITTTPGHVVFSYTTYFPVGLMLIPPRVKGDTFQPGLRELASQCQPVYVLE